MLIDEYFKYQIEYEKKYGKNALVLMQVGSFFEFYGVDNNQEKIGNAQYITELLNIQLTRRNKAILENSRSNCLMGGFPTHALKRFIHILLNHNFTIILIEQVTEPPNPKREITNIFSPGTYIEEINNFNPHNIVSIYINEEKCYKSNDTLYIFGISSIDLSTGNNLLYEANLGYYDKNAFFEEIYRFIETNNPKEIIITNTSTNINREMLNNKINVSNRIIHYNEKLDKKYTNVSYQNEYLKNIFSDCGLLSVIEYLDLERKTYALISFLLLLEFSFEHNERIIEKIKKPILWEYDEHLILYHNANYQLNIFSLNNNENHKYKSLFHIIDKTSTHMGKRLLKYILNNPSTNVSVIEKRYNMIDNFIKSGNIDKFDKILNEIIDFERMHRRMSLNVLHPYEFLNLTYTYENILSVIDLVKSNLNFEDYGLDNEVIKSFKDYINEYENIFDLNEMGKYGLLNIYGSFFKKNNFVEIDKVQHNIDEINKFFEDEMKNLSNISEEGSDFVKREYTDRDGHFLYITKKRSELLVKNLGKDHKYEIKKYTGTNVKIVSEEISRFSDKLVKLKEEIKVLTKEKYIYLLNDIYNKYKDTFIKLSNFISYLDFIKSGAKCALVYNYNKPEINDYYDKKSFLKIKGLRHPIIEIINEEYDYITNDVDLDYLDNNGILLYGVNGVGKSSLSKAIGCNILLAQIGYYVSCKEFNYYPYKKIFTRINGDDNIFKGMSSFVVEMDELRSILKYSDSNSIVLGDEICKGTEETSALSIVTSSILRFCKNNVQFILATHFHKLCEMKCIKSIDNIHFKHLSINFENDKLIYGRKLLDGPGNNLYGLEIANFVIDDKEFINDAKKIRKELLYNDINIDELTKKSNYNNKLYAKSCSICGKSEKELDTHHIIEQNTFEEHNVFKNKLSNLVVLCQEHHNQVHNGNLIIHGYDETSEGKELKYEYVDRVNKKKKYNDEQIKIIKNIWDEYNEYKNQINTVLIELKKKEITISKTTLKKIITNSY